jgi:hypothetical protein
MKCGEVIHDKSRGIHQKRAEAAFDRLRNPQNSLVKISDQWDVTRNGYLPIAKQECQPLHSDIP